MKSILLTFVFNW